MDKREVEGRGIQNNIHECDYICLQSHHINVDKSLTHFRVHIQLYIYRLLLLYNYVINKIRILS